MQGPRGRNSSVMCEEEKRSLSGKMSKRMLERLSGPGFAELCRSSQGLWILFSEPWETTEELLIKKMYHTNVK